MKEGTNNYIDGILENLELSMVSLGKSIASIEQEFGKTINSMEDAVNTEIEKIRNDRKELK